MLIRLKELRLERGYSMTQAVLIPKGHTILMNGDTIVTMTDESDASSVHDRMEVLCKEQEKLK